MLLKHTAPESASGTRRENAGTGWCFQCVTILSHSCGNYVLISYSALKGITAPFKAEKLPLFFYIPGPEEPFPWCRQPQPAAVALLRRVKSIQDQLQTASAAVDDSSDRKSVV